MGVYVILSKLTDDGAKTLKKNPERVKEVNQELERMGVKVVKQYVVFGEYDFVNIVEAESNMAVMKAMVELASRGTIRTITMPAVEVEEFLSSLKS
ncbi:hypothetical protein GAH_01047 [Geoglobus ahangari]|uniref:GYD domain-containing protein n=1 Tax=Geoglobus ahangari TaxID=113653 RepID=A0A0F7DBT1_9EURY|nr:GYD domain-containing protein [Geoglobus ahangari]AKG91631.1 hypothetical protein GAH_01047 [Geoglobus ahangari]NOY11524.1 GYD domain-containing protein [Archaeoglobi archaeon]